MNITHHGHAISEEQFQIWMNLLASDSFDCNTNTKAGKQKAAAIFETTCAANNCPIPAGRGLTVAVERELIFNKDKA